MKNHTKEMVKELNEYIDIVTDMDAFETLNMYPGIVTDINNLIEKIANEQQNLNVK